MFYTIIMLATPFPSAKAQEGNGRRWRALLYSSSGTLFFCLANQAALLIPHPLGFTPSKCVVNNAFSPCAAAGAGCGDWMMVMAALLGEPVTASAHNAITLFTVHRNPTNHASAILMIVLLFLCKHLASFFAKKKRKHLIWYTKI